MASAYQTKRDAWITAVIWVGVLMTAFAGTAQLRADLPLVFRGLVLLGSILICGLMLWVVYGTSYTLEEKELLIRCGPLRYRVPLAEIDSVTPSRNPLSSPAGSLDRIQVRWSSGERSLLISPEPRAAFLEELARLCPQLHFDGSTLVRSDGLGPASLGV